MYHVIYYQYITYAYTAPGLATCASPSDLRQYTALDGRASFTTVTWSTWLETQTFPVQQQAGAAEGWTCNPCWPKNRNRQQLVCILLYTVYICMHNVNKCIQILNMYTLLSQKRCRTVVHCVCQIHNTSANDCKLLYLYTCVSLHLMCIQMQVFVSTAVLLGPNTLCSIQACTAFT